MFAEFSAGHPWFVHASGMAASIVSLVLWVPQVRKTWSHRNNSEELAGLSVLTQYILILSQILWLVYGVLISSFWVWSSLIVNVPAAVLTLYLIHRAKLRLRAAGEPLPAPEAI
ncbi:MAG: hypothetical protein FWG25_01770 [Promicromonosporaceae bacterium]|nr:hypothetical protein [Promicromonosporaceae bacterium]